MLDGVEGVVVGGLEDEGGGRVGEVGKGVEGKGVGGVGGGIDVEEVWGRVIVDGRIEVV